MIQSDLTFKGTHVPTHIRTDDRDVTNLVTGRVLSNSFYNLRTYVLNYLIEECRLICYTILVLN